MSIASRTVRRAAGAIALAACLALPAWSAERILIRGATVHTMTDRGTLERADVLIEDGRIAGIGAGLAAPAGTEVVSAEGKVVTPGLFGGLSRLGLEEIGLEPSTDDAALRLGEMRPEFDVGPAYDPDSTAVAVNRIDGITFTVIAPSAESGGERGPGGSIVAGQAAVVALDGAPPLSNRALVVDLGADSNGLAGGTRAAQFMLLRQALMEARTPNLVLAQDQRLLTPLGRQALLGFLDGRGLVLFDVDRASDIRAALDFAKRERLRAAIVGGAEAWRVAGELAAAKVPVILDPLLNLPVGFDAVGATLENAARLHRAGVAIAFSFDSSEAHNLRKIRQAAGNAVAHGLPHAAALAALTRTPAEIFGVADRVGSLAVGRPADLVLWSGDPLEVTTVAERVFVGGRDQPMRSRQTELRDRYLERLRAGQAR